MHVVVRCAAEIDVPRLKAAARAVLSAEGPAVAEVNVAVVDDPAIHQLNRTFLDHDYPTDVITFPMHQSPQRLEGEIVVSADTAAANAPDYGWDAASELTLYVIHGCLHLVGYNDKGEKATREMRKQEAFYLAQLGMTPPRPAAGAGDRATKPRRRRPKSRPRRSR
ncbi:MAG: rRNA maturation RNase YbeY [Pirellulales bacterium]|nr:rRNA maturation RNase YbeY [Pirellulales bacterium]